MTIYEFMTILDMQTDVSAKVMDTLYVPVKIGDDQPYCRFGTASLVYFVSDNCAYHRKLVFYLLSYKYHRNLGHSS